MIHISGTRSKLQSWVSEASFRAPLRTHQPRRNRLTWPETAVNRPMPRPAKQSESTDELEPIALEESPHHGAEGQRYSLRQFLGKGAMGELHVAQDNALVRKVAFKQMAAKAAQRRTGGPAPRRAAGDPQGRSR